MQHKPLDILKRSEARLAAVKAFYANEINERKKEPLTLALEIISYYHEENRKRKIDEKFLSELIEGTLEHEEEINKKIKENLGKDWSIERLGIVLHAIVKLATYELMALHKTPYKVIINEYIDIAHSYVDEKETKFVNGILDTIARQVRNDE